MSTAYHPGWRIIPTHQSPSPPNGSAKPAITSTRTLERTPMTQMRPKNPCLPKQNAVSPTFSPSSSRMFILLYLPQLSHAHLRSSTSIFPSSLKYHHSVTTTGSPAQGKPSIFTSARAYSFLHPFPPPTTPPFQKRGTQNSPDDPQTNSKISCSADTTINPS